MAAPTSDHLISTLRRLLYKFPALSLKLIFARKGYIPGIDETTVHQDYFLVICAYIIAGLFEDIPILFSPEKKFTGSSAVIYSGIRASYTLVLANFEFLSSIFCNFKMFFRDRYPIKRNGWKGLSTFEEFSVCVGFPDREPTHIGEAPRSRRTMGYQDESRLFVIIRGLV